MKKFWIVAGLCMTFIFATACNQGGGSADDDSAPMELSLYFTQMREQMEPVLEGFTARYPNISVVDFRAPVEEMMATIDMELRANNPQFDVLISANNAIVDIQERHSPFAEFIPDERNYIVPGLLDPNNIQIPVGTGFYVIIYNTNLVSHEEAPKAWHQIIDDRWMNQVAIADPRSSGSVWGFFWHILDFHGSPPYGWQFFEQLQELNPNYIPSHGTIGELVALGERTIGVQVMATAQSSIARGDPINFIFPYDGMPSELNVALLREGTPNQRAAELFINYILSQEGQQLVSDHLGYIPVRYDMDFTFVDGSTLADIELISRDVYWIASNREYVLDRFRDIAGD